MKCHMSVDVGTGYVHTIKATSANICDIIVVSDLILEDKQVMYSDSTYLGIQTCPEVVHEEHLSTVDYHINPRLSRFSNMSNKTIDWIHRIEQHKSSVRCKVEHILCVIKRQYGYRKGQYQDMMKNENRLYACANLYLLVMAGQGRGRHDRFSLFRASEYRNQKKP